MKSFLLAAVTLGATAGLSIASPLIVRAEEPCKKLRDAVDKWYKDNNIVPRTPKNAVEALITPPVPAAPVPPSLALACLKSLPLDKETALKQIAYLRPQWQWQSSVEYLKNPPKGYLSEGVDLLGGLDEIEAKLKNNAYRTEFELLVDLHMLANVRVREYHFSATNELMELFTFKSGAEFVSISKDGTALPEIFAQEDIKHDRQKYAPSPVSTIDGVPVVTYLKKESSLVGGAHDPDARYNAVSWSLAKASTYFPYDSGKFHFGLQDTTTVKFLNNSARTFTNTAFVRANLTNVTSAESLYNDYGLGQGQAPLGWASYMASERNFTASWSGYPTPANQTRNGAAAGFLPTSPKLKDTAVLAVTSFASIINPLDPADFILAPEGLWNAMVAVLTRARAENRTKLIIDMQSNSGGLLSSMALLYYALFPPGPGIDAFPFLWQARAHPQLAWLVDRVTATAAPNATEWIWNFRNALQYLDPDTNQSFPTMADWYGPPTAQQPHLTPPALLNLTVALDSTFWARLAPRNAQQPFRPEHITVLTDGLCGSGCAIFVELLSRVHGVRTVVVGGRPQNTAMQAVGMVKGGPVNNFQTWDSVLARNWSVPEALDLPKATKPPLMMMGYKGGTSVNLFNMLDPRGKGDGTPLQFGYEAANCRIWYEWEMATRMEAVWERVAEVSWGEGKCAEGSTTGKGGEMGGKLGYEVGVEDEVKLEKGPGSVG